MNFKELIKDIAHTHSSLQQESAKSINVLLTLRNWMIGFQIQEYEQNGEDRAAYGTSLLQRLAKELTIKGLVAAELSRCRQFYRTYPLIGRAILNQWKPILPPSILGTASQKLLIDSSDAILGTVSQESEDKYKVPVKQLISRLSYSHFTELIKLDEALKRSFYELESIKGNWSVRELKRQINTLYYERCGLSSKPEALSEKVQSASESDAPAHIVKSIYAFDFLGLEARELVEEKDLEAALLNHLQDFMLELGNGFCFEARQKRLLIDDEYYFADMVFYHRILKCHVIIELKTDRFKPQHLAQLNTYVSYYREEEMCKGDNPPIGILLCTQQGKKLVEYALSGMDENLFVSKYLIDLPSKEVLSNFLLKELEILKNE